MKTIILFFLTLLFWAVVGFSQFVQDITPAELNNYVNYGTAVDISGTTAIVSSPGDDTNGGNSGAVYFFEKNGPGWQQTIKTFGADNTSNTGFGRAVAISGNHALVGALYDNDLGSGAGAVYIFSKTNGGWVQSQKVYSDNPGDNNNFGFSVDIHNNWAVIGAHYDDVQGVTNTGAVYLFKLEGEIPGI